MNNFLKKWFHKTIELTEKEQIILETLGWLLEEDDTYTSINFSRTKYLVSNSRLHCDILITGFSVAFVNTENSMSSFFPTYFLDLCKGKIVDKITSELDKREDDMRSRELDIVKKLASKIEKVGNHGE